MHSPFTDILHTNAVPSDADCVDILKLLESPRQEVADLTEEIGRLQSLLDETTRKRDKLKQFIDAHLSLVSPARRLPDDIVRAIFTACLPSARNPTITSDEAPLLLCQLCRAWRSIALTTPRIWARIHIVVPAQAKLQHITDVVSTWFTRSGTVPIDVSMVYSQTCEVVCDISPLLSGLISASRRWKNIQIILPRNDMDRLLPLSSNDVPLLQHMSLSLRARGPRRFANEHSETTKAFRFLGSKSLRSVAFPSNKHFLQSPVSWGSLKHLTINQSVYERLEYDAARTILRQCPLLETCELHLFCPKTWNGTPVPAPFSLPFLSHLSIKQGRIPLDGSHFFYEYHLPGTTFILLPYRRCTRH
ncbi:hypothetical protein C8R44DRAFT_99150 [Mycena epipterygia]|nr:hypothetical protein C8R44DRAFT_99150 [Mycena epipterygia]